jgi:hypothetical protein
VAKKTISKSVRLSEEVYEIVMNSPGYGFNEKFENLIMESKYGEVDRKKRLSDLNKCINEQQRKLYQLFDRYRFIEDFFHDFDIMRDDFEKVKIDLDRAINADSEK